MVVLDAGSHGDVGEPNDVLTPRDEGPAARPFTPTGVAWTDETSVRGLERDCNYRPTRAEGEEDTLSCQHDVFQQACTEDPCPSRVGMPCRRGCAHTCAGCHTTCRGECQQCRQRCTDAACRLACARSCGACLQTCLDTRDRCFTAVCTAREEQCTREVGQRFQQQCARSCGQCYDQCEEGTSQYRCLTRCLRRLGRCDSVQTRICTFNGPRFGSPDE